MTEEQQRKCDQFLAAWDTDIGLAAGYIAKKRGVSLEAALSMIASMQMAAVRDELTKAQRHPTYNPDCPHCVEQKRVQEIATRFMERVLKQMEKDDEDGSWISP
jgi:hypothetical protein